MASRIASEHEIGNSRDMLPLSHTVRLMKKNMELTVTHLSFCALRSNYMRIQVAQHITNLGMMVTVPSTTSVVFQGTFLKLNVTGKEKAKCRRN